jgi:hypothetical protein
MEYISPEHPTEHWVNQPMSNGPTEVKHYFTDNKENKSSRRPPGRTNQWEKGTLESVASKQNSDTNTLRAQHLRQVDEELEAVKIARDLKVMEDVRKIATTEEAKVPYSTLLYCTVLLYCTALHCTVLYCTVLYCTVLYCTVAIDESRIDDCNDITVKCNINTSTSQDMCAKARYLKLDISDNGFQMAKTCYLKHPFVKNSKKKRPKDRFRTKNPNRLRNGLMHGM